MRLRWIGVGACMSLIGLIVGWGAWTAHDERRCRSLLDRARQEMDRGRYAEARTALTQLLARRPGWDEAAYELGVCEQARRRIRAATEAWAMIPDSSPFSALVQLRQSRIDMDQGRWDRCEALLHSAAGRPGSHRAEARWGLVLLLRLEGRFEEAKRWLEDGFDVMTDPIYTLRRLYRLDTDPYPTEGVRQALDRAGGQTPRDDRVWLGRAHLAIRLGQFEEARRWLDRCRERRPEDLAVWRMWLEWALAAGRAAEAREALSHLPAGQEPEGRVFALRTWFAARRGDIEGERRALRERLSIDSADIQALERLAELELEAGRAEASALLRQQRAELDRIRKDYERWLGSERPAEHAAELAQLADRLGRRFDARRWAALAAGGARSRVPDHPVRDLTSKPVSGSMTTLADLLPEVARSDRPVAPAPAPTVAGVPRLQFSDDAATAGLPFTQENGGAAGRLIPPVTSSGGVGLIDIDNDGWLDVYVVQGGPFPPDPCSAQPGDRLFHNRGDGTFEDITARSGIVAMPRGYGHGVAVGDYDNDGYADLFVTRWGSYALYRNRGDGTFRDMTARAGLAGGRDWPTSAVFADLDNDGDLDLYVCHYLKWDEKDLRSCSDPNDPAIYNCNPLDFDALPDHVFRNDGGRFVDVTRDAGVDDRHGRGWGVLAADFDDDGRVELFVANDMTANYLFKNRGGNRFEEIGLTSGVAGNASGGYQAGMGVACGDLDGDGHPDLAVTNFYNESTTFFRNLGRGFFGDHSAAIGLAASSRYMLGFGIAFLDIDNDGWLDLMTANGHIHDGRPQYPWKMPVQLFRNSGGAQPRLLDVSADAGPPFRVPRMGRGLAAGDLDNDGRIDTLVVSQNEPLAFFRNCSAGGHFLTLRLEGTTSNRDAVGARVTVRCGGRARVAQRVGGGSFQSASDPRLHFGLGSATSVDRVEVRWPSGQVDHYLELRADGGYLLREGETKPLPLRGWER